MTIAQTKLRKSEGKWYLELDDQIIRELDIVQDASVELIAEDGVLKVSPIRTMPDPTFHKAMKESLSEYESAYRKLAE